MVVLQLTMAVLKPHITKNPVALQIIRDRIISGNFNIVRNKRKVISILEIEKFYSEHKKKFFYNRLVTLMTSGPSDLLILAKKNAITEWRNVMGPTKSYKAQYEAPDSIRGQFGLSDTRNATHGSDSQEAAAREIEIFFPEFNIQKWFAEEEPLFRENRILFIKELFIHQPIK